MHGLELKHLVSGLNELSFDDFVHDILNIKVPTGNDFIPYYPYFFHKKTVISASVISENLTATFGNAGFVLSVPPENYICGSAADIGTPTDRDFYSERSLITKWQLTNLQAKYPLPKLNDLLPQEKVKASGCKILDHQSGSSVNEAKAALRMVGIDNPTETQILKFLESVKNDPLTRMHAAVMETTPRKISIYNEIAINPVKLVGNIPKAIKITGIFLRTSLEDLKKYLDDSHVRKLMNIAKEFDLPVVLINDGKFYDTDLSY